jgi:hypothetical protein
MASFRMMPRGRPLTESPASNGCFGKAMGPLSTQDQRTQHCQLYCQLLCQLDFQLCCQLLPPVLLPALLVAATCQLAT